MNVEQLEIKDKSTIKVDKMRFWRFKEQCHNISKVIKTK